MTLPPPSLRTKIRISYYLVVTLFILLVLFARFELKLFESNLEESGKITDFFDTMLEIRRFEKNYFLYHQIADYNENQHYIAQALKLLHNNIAVFDYQEIDTTLLSTHLNHYAKLMDYYRAQRSVEMASQIRKAGKILVAHAEQLAITHRIQQRQLLERQRQILLISAILLIGAILILGRWLSWRVVQPLQQVEIGMKAVAGGKRDKLDIQSQDREIVLLIEAVNSMLKELELRQTYLIRSEKLAALGTLLSGMAHELNNPLSNISTSCQILQEELPELEFHQELLAQIDEQTQRARNIVRTLLDFTRVRQFKRESLELAELLQETIQFLRGQLPTQIELTLDIPAGLRVAGDKQRLQQVFLNLLKNALESVADSGTVRLCASRHAPQPVEKCLNSAAVCIEIIDSGAGIAPEVLPRIFDPFFTTKEVGHGSGLGLFIVHEIIEEHSGCISAANLPQGGAVFTVWLPADA
jgi:two-component system, NtrC family, sensor kinase